MTAKIPNELVLEDIRKVIAETGSTKFKDYKCNGKYSECTVTRVTGNWTKFLESEGYVNNHPRSIPKDELVADIQKVFAETGSTKQENYLRNGKFSKAAIKRLFGSWNKMLRALGYQVNMVKPGQYTKEDILENYLNLKTDFGRPLSAAEFRKYGNYSQAVVDKVFGSFTNMKKELGEIIDARFLSDEELEQDLLRLYKTYHVLSQELICQESIVSYPTILARYGSLETVCHKLNIPFSPLKSKSKLLIQCLSSVKKYLGDNYILEKTFPWLRNPATNHPLFLDIFYPDLKLAIEVDGGQHHTICRFSPTKEALEAAQFRDKNKDKLMKEHGYKIIRLTKPSLSYVKEKLKDVI